MNYQVRNAMDELNRAENMDTVQKAAMKLERGLYEMDRDYERAQVDKESAKKELEFVRSLQNARIEIREFFLWVSGLSILGLVVTVSILAFKLSVK